MRRERRADCACPPAGRVVVHAANTEQLQQIGPNRLGFCPGKAFIHQAGLEVEAFMGRVDDEKTGTISYPALQVRVPLRLWRVSLYRSQVRVVVGRVDFTKCGDKPIERSCARRVADLTESSHI